MTEASTHPKVNLKEGPGAGKTIELEKAELILGRDPSVDVCLHPKRIAQARPPGSIGGQLSTRGSWQQCRDIRRGEQITAPALKTGDEIRLGPAVLFTFELPPPARLKPC